ncbi:MAG: hypothetical protein JST75_05700 [Bacteroidetes bacterium]|nr:hypothetical protein [Bacteroidota bacterium]
MKILLLFTDISSVRELITASIDVAGKEDGVILGLFLKRKSQPKPFSQIYSGRQKSESEEMPFIAEITSWAIETCAAAGISFVAVYEKEITLSQLIGQATYHDLVIADARTDFNDYLLTSLNASLKDMLVDAHCPILLIRPGGEPLSKIIFTYDGSYSSMHAIKMFSYLFPMNRNIPVSLVSVNSNRDDQAENEKYLAEWLAHHYSNIEKEVLNQNVKEQLLASVNKFAGNVHVVISAYGKEAYARIFHPSHVHLLLKFSKASLFVSHE